MNLKHSMISQSRSHIMKLKGFHQVTFSDSSVGKESTYNARGPSSIPGSGRSSGEGIVYPRQYSSASLVAQPVKNLPQCGRPGFDPWVGQFPGERKGYWLQYSGLENSMDSIVHGVAKSWTWLSDFHVHFHQVTISISEHAEIKSLFSKWGQTSPWQANHLARSVPHSTDVSDDATVKRRHTSDLLW